MAKSAHTTRSRVTRRHNAFPIVGIGASAGGLEALEELFAEMPTDTGLGFVVVMHQHAGHPSLLTELLGKKTTLPVIEAADQMPVEPNRIHVCPPGAFLALLRGKLERMEVESSKNPHLPIDYFFRSLAQDQKEKAIGIVLSGTGTDGTLGLRTIKAEEGMVMAQQMQSAKYAGMPSSAIATGLVDYVLPPGAMPQQLVAYARGQCLAPVRVSEPDEAFQPTAAVQKFLVLLRTHTGNDFSHYKGSTIQRRIERRMGLHRIKAPTQYLRYLQENPHELDILNKELLIRVTGFFRDPPAFQTLAKAALPTLLKSRPENYTLRAWVPGCSTGEEVFSLAILLQEGVKALKRPFEFQIFGTDLDDEAVASARNAQYPEGIAADVSPERLERFFVREDAAYRVCKDLRDMTIFATQNLIKDPPFTRLDLISCRNLLIYLNPEVQKRLLPVFHYALKPGGLLVLGPSETIGNSTDLFETVDKKWKIFRRKEAEAASHAVLDMSGDAVRTEAATRMPTPPRPTKEAKLTATIERLLLARFAPASLVVNERGDIVYIHGRTGTFLEPASGQARLNMLEMAREGLRLELASALREVAAGLPEAIRPGVRVRTNGDYIHVDLSVTRLREPEAVRDLLLVTVRPQSPPSETPPPTRRARKPADEGWLQELERELKASKESLQTTIEELETANEDLKCTNEELQSTNEELQSANEELETSREEMQSLNEELTTVNAELEAKVEGLSRANDDMQNLLNSTEIATIFLDDELRIKRYTEQARSLVNLIQTDIGRPLGDLVSSVNSNLDYDRLVADCQEVLHSLAFTRKEVRTRDGDWYLLRIIPYRTAENVIDGLVLTFVDITERKRGEDALTESEKHYREVFETDLTADVVYDANGIILDCNPAFLRLFGIDSMEAARGQSIARFYDSRKVFQSLIERVRAERVLDRHEVVRITTKGVRRFVEQKNVGVFTDKGVLRKVRAYIFDVTERKQAEETMKNQLAEIRSYYDNAPIGLAVLDTDLRFLRINERLAQVNGRPAHEHIGKTVQEMVPPLAACARQIAAEIIASGRPKLGIELPGETPAQPSIKQNWAHWVQSWYPLKNETGELVGLSVIVQEKPPK